MALRTQLNNELSIAVDWFKHNGLIANRNKFQLMVLGDDHEFSLAVDGIEIIDGMILIYWMLTTLSLRYAKTNQAL